MSAPAPALLRTRRRVVVVRLADPAEAVTILSAVFGLLLIFLPVSFPRMIVTNWQQGRLTPLMMAFTLLLDTFLYLRAAHLMSAKPGVVASACLGSLPLLIVGGLSLLLQSAVTLTLSTDLPNLLGRTSEEILAHTYLALVAAVFLPFIVIRFLQQFRAPHL